MDAMADDVLKKMDEALNYVIHHKPPISSNRTKEITKIALSNKAVIVPMAKKIEDFIAKAPSAHKLSGLYLVDSICKARDECTELYRQHFAQNIHVAVSHVLRVPADKERESVRKVVRLWVERNVFPFDAIERTVAILKEHAGYTTLEEVNQLLAPFGEYALQPPPPSLEHDANAQPPVEINPWTITTTTQQADAAPSDGASSMTNSPNQQKKPVLDSEALENLVNTLPNFLPPSQFTGMSPCFTIPLAAPSQTGLTSQTFYDEEEDQEDPRKVIASRNSREKEACRKQLEVAEAASRDCTSASSEAEAAADVQQNKPLAPSSDASPNEFQPSPPDQQRQEQQPHFPYSMSVVAPLYPEQQRVSSPRTGAEQPPPFVVLPSSGDGGGGGGGHSLQPGGWPDDLLLSDENAPGAAPKSEHAHSATLFVGNLAPSITEERLRGIFSAHGPLCSINFKANKYFAFISYNNHLDAETAKAIESGRFADGREMKIGWGKATSKPYGAVSVAHDGSSVSAGGPAYHGSVDEDGSGCGHAGKKRRADGGESGLDKRRANPSPRDRGNSAYGYPPSQPPYSASSHVRGNVYPSSMYGS